MGTITATTCTSSCNGRCNGLLQMFILSGNTCICRKSRNTCIALHLFTRTCVYPWIPVSIVTSCKCTLLINTLINTFGFYANISHDSHSAVQLDSLACIPVVSAPLSLERATSVNCTLQAWPTRYNRQVYHTTRTRLLHHEQLVSSCPYNIAACITC